MAWTPIGSTMSDLHGDWELFKRSVMRREDGPDGDSPEAIELWERLLPELQEPPRRPRVGLRVLLVAAALVVIAATAAISVNRQSVTRSDAVACFSAADTDASRILPSRDLSDPAAACRDLWEQGMVPSVAYPPGSVPPLVVCVGREGSAWVFPGDASTCSRLGLADVDPSESSDVPPLAELVDLLETRMPHQVCITPIHRARPIVEEALEELGLDTWTVRVRAPDPQMRCAAYVIDPHAERVDITSRP